MAASCVDQLLGVSATSSSCASWVPRASPQLLRLSTANSASIPILIAEHALHFNQRSSKHTVSASKKKRSPILDFDDDEEDDEDSDDEDNEFLDMEEWMKNKPSGFGGTKVYDTSLEDQLLEEIKRDELAQLASKNKKPTPAVKPAKKSGNDVPPDGVEVFVKNLPRKKNVERDMRAALRSVSGLLHIRPLVLGNEKTREPVCKGLAFLTFATQDDAEEFVERYNDESIVFGKVEKKIVCELAKSSSPYKENSPTQAANGPRLGVRDPSSGDISIVTSSTCSLAVENAVVASKVKKSTRNLASSPKDEDEDPRNVDDSSEEDDADLFVLEQQIWDELENEEDFDLDLELEAEIEVLEGDSGDASASSFSEEGSNFALSDGEDVRQLEDEDENRPQVSGQGFGSSTIFVESRDDDRVSRKRSVEGLDAKEKKIRELEAKLEELQSQLNKRNSIEFPKATDAKVNVQEQERKIESLEKRLLSRSKAGKNTNVSNGKPASASGKSEAKKVQKNSTSASQKVSQDKKSKQQPRLKLGAASRLKKREREIFTEALLKYSAPSRD